MVRVRITQISLAAITAGLAFAVLGCGGSTNNAQPVSAPTRPAEMAASTASAVTGTAGDAPSAAAEPAGGLLCNSADIKLSVGRGDAAAGTVYRPLVFTNGGDHPCVIQGFPGVSYAGGADGHQVGAAAVRTGTKGAPITLNKGDSAYADIGMVNVQNYDPVTCQPQPVRGLRVYPPQETASMFVDLPTTGCGNHNIPGNQLTVKTIEKGTGGH
jgi:Protein of unknown function (DUF4232)